ncbi:DNA replication protein psf1 [Chytriomyces hyalinus]|nr:DNA replication protein psf1 [Chytriomyces hyalinus]
MSNSGGGSLCFGDEGLKLVRDVKRSRDSGIFHAYNDTGVRNVKLEMKYLLDGITSLLERRAVLARVAEQGSAAGRGGDGRGDAAVGAESSQAALELSQGCGMATHMHLNALRRNRRLLLVYHRARMDSLRDMAWELGGGGAGVGAVQTDARTNAVATNSDDDEDVDMDSDRHTTSNNNKNNNSHPSGLPHNVIRAMSPNELSFLNSYHSLLEDYRGTMLDIDLAAPLVPPSDLFIDIRVLRDLGEIVTESGSILKLMAGDQLYVKRTDVEKFITLGYAVQI